MDLAARDVERRASPVPANGVWRLSWFGKKKINENERRKAAVFTVVEEKRETGVNVGLSPNGNEPR